MTFHRPNEIIRKQLIKDDAVVFFGGEDWKAVSNDLSGIPQEDRPYFILCLLMVVLTDQCLYTYQPDSYASWRKVTSFPKFGWAGFGAHNENPLKILWAPEREKVVNVDEVLKLIPQFVEFMLTETKSYFQDSLSSVNP